MKNLLNKYKYQLLLLVIVVMLFLVNYQSGTHLTGWDNLQTELNPGLAVKRAFFSIWEEYQSFGLTAGMAHAADLPRAIFLWLSSFVFPQNMIRYFYHFLMLLIGGLGMIKMIIGLDPRLRGDDADNNGTMKQSNNEIFAFFGALFYMLNLGTLQIFYLPFESFSTFFALLPWGIWIFLKIIDNESTKQSNNWLLFLLINLLGVSSFYSQQFFIVYVLVLGCIALGKLIKDYGRISLSKITKTFVLILIINSFWILPQIYFLKSNGDWVTQSKTNQIATEDTLYQNLEKGTINNFLRLEGFYFDLKGVHNTPLFAPWKDYFSGVFGLLPYAFAGLMILGFLKTIKEKRVGFVLIFVLCATMLLLATSPFSWINEFVRQIPIINQIFRSPFTKFIIPYSLVYSFFVAQGLSFFGTKLKKVSPYIIFIFIILYALPSFQGYFFSPEMRVKIPSDYFQVMNYFKTTNKNKRIALLPDYTFWGWFFNKWGYNGSGFMWYGIEQPIVSRTFDVWSSKSESYFWEQKQALESENLSEYERILDKYNIDYLIMDYSLIPLVSSYKSLAIDRIENLLSKSQKISLFFRGENIALYRVNHPQKIESFVTLSSGLKNIGPKIKLFSEDRTYQENGDYITEKNHDIYYPFADLTTQTRIKDKLWSLEEMDQAFSINSDIFFNPNDYKLYLQSTSEASLINDQKITDLKLNLSPFYQDKQIKINFEKILVKSFDVNNFNNDLAEFALTAPELPQKYGYLIKIKSKNIKGSPLFFYITDETKKQSMLEEKLRNETEYFILPHKFDYGLGYSLIFQNKSYLNYPSENLLEEVSIYLFPYEELKNAKFVKNNLILTNPSYSNDFTAKKINYFTYSVSFNNETRLRSSSFDGQAMKQSNNLILYQSFDPGWIAFANGKLLDHVLVNNWANGWKLQPEVNNVTIIFWPQYLEFLGFILLVIAFFAILKIKEKHE